MVHEQGPPVATRYLAMDGLRGLAALSVVAVHLSAYGMFPPGLHNPAVDMFFILSGFVIADAYEQRMDALGVWSFMKLRLARLYPTYALALLIVVAFTLFIWIISSVPRHPGNTFVSVAFQALFLPTPPMMVPPDRPAFLVNNPAWSLFWELLINLAYALCITRLRTWHLCVVTAIGGMGLALVAWAGRDVFSGSDWATWWIGGLRVLYGFPLGLLLHRMPRATFSTPFVLLAALAAASLFVPPLVALFAIVPLTIWLATRSSARSAWIIGLGELSYPLYALHTPLFEPLTWLAARVLHLPIAWYGPFLFAFVCALSWFALVWWDRPLREGLRQRLSSRLAGRVANPAMSQLAN